MKFMVLQNKNQFGFIPMIIALLVIIAVVIWFVFIRVNNAGGQ